MDAPPLNPALDLLAGVDLDPQTMVLLKLLMGQQAHDPVTDDPEPLRQRLLGLERANRDLLRMVDQLAGALGACRECWGADSACPVCAGEGHPGYFLPDRPAFQAFVLPVVRAMAARATSGQMRRPPSGGNSASPFVLNPATKEH